MHDACAQGFQPCQGSWRKSRAARTGILSRGTNGCRALRRLSGTPRRMETLTSVRGRGKMISKPLRSEKADGDGSVVPLLTQKTIAGLHDFVINEAPRPFSPNGGRAVELGAGSGALIASEELGLGRASRR